MSITPFGRPVVPEVYINRWMSSPPTAARAGIGSAARPANGSQPAGGSADTQKRAGADASPAIASSARSVSASSHTSTLAPECSSRYRSSAAARRQLMGIATAPRELAAKIVARNSVLLYDSSPTTSPNPTPRSRSPPANRADQSTMSWYVTVVPSQTAIALSGVRAAWCSSTRTQLMSADDAGEAGMAARLFVRLVVTRI